MDKDELKKKLTEEEYRVTQEKGTEAPFTGKYWDDKNKGKYACKVCGQALFDSETKLDSSIGPAGLQGWPAFEDAIPGSVEFIQDDSHGMSRTEAVCANCKSHLGHLFDDDTSTGKHLCINSCSIDLEKEG
ncbi:MAG: peptide-methionine (R)-S-oxide reductase MsrB [bacterium]|nr:peptide-methionine (R)-S-oxide reductase MsrB [bacterium]